MPGRIVPHGSLVERRALKQEQDTGNRLVELLSTFSALQRNGRALLGQIRGSLDEMRRLRMELKDQPAARFEPRPTPSQHPESDLRNIYGLTRREQEVAALLAQGHSNASISSRLRISPHTARHHTQRVLAKLEVHSRSAAGAKLRNPSIGPVT